MALANPNRGWSKTALADEFGVDRRTASKIIGNVQPAGTERGQPVYALSDVAHLFSEFNGKRGSSEDKDPSVMEPKQRLDWFNSEKARLSFEAEIGTLIKADEVGALLEMVFSQVKTTLVTQPDVLEMECDLNAEQVQKMIDINDRLLDDLAERLIENAKRLPDSGSADAADSSE